ncbi:MAG: DNA pilot protein [Microviridae sp.]|nr:MAG: DNA pilot protein [Microviridae sp.]
MWPAIIAGGASLLGGLMRNQASARQAQAQMDFQERMSSTSHQREVADLRAAGLNPILSATGGHGASTPVGAMAPMEDVISPAVHSAFESEKTQADVDIKKQEVRIKELEKLLKEATNPPAIRAAGMLDSGLAAIPEATKSAIEAVMNHFFPLTSSAAAHAREAVRPIVDAAGAVGDALVPGADGRTAGGRRRQAAVEEVLKGAPAAVKAWFTPSARALELRDAVIPPAARGVPMGKSRGKLGGANTWDIGSSRHDR